MLSIRIAASVSHVEKTPTRAGVTAVNDFIVVNPRESLTYIVGDKINLGLKTEHGKNPLKWNFLNLPAELIGQEDGVIRGIFEKEGYYSFSATANDAEGHFADCYFTLNVQPKESQCNYLIIQLPL